MKQVAIALDQLCNTLIGGWADETLSARAWRHRALPVWKQARWLIDTVFFWQQNHCYKAFAAEAQRKQLPTDYREGA